jgi:hypothetical protein
MFRTPAWSKSARTSLRKASVSRNCSAWTSGGWSFFTVFGLIPQPGELVGQAHELFGQFLKAPVVGQILLHLGGLLSGDALGELLAVEVGLEDVVGTALVGGVALGGAEELLAERAAAEAVDGLHLLEELLALLAEGVNA